MWMYTIHRTRINNGRAKLIERAKYLCIFGCDERGRTQRQAANGINRYHYCHCILLLQIATEDNDNEGEIVAVAVTMASGTLPLQAYHRAQSLGVGTNGCVVIVK